eukprot:NODE_839_length_3777_cov_0.281131.p1 type:complete len:400 gc:universal NODE_839_length_3777_cov_0.281131:216-1415(+)
MDSDDEFYFSGDDNDYSALSPQLDTTQLNQNEQLIPFSTISYQICQSVDTLIAQAVATVSQILNISPDHAAILLLLKRFKTEDLIQEAMSGELLQTLQVVNKRQPRNSNHICPICYVNNIVIFLNCSHFACLDCIKQFILSQLNENQIQNLTCLELDCPYYMTRQFIHHVDSSLTPVYDLLFRNNFINSSLQLKHCIKCNAIVQLNTSLNVLSKTTIIPIVTCQECSTQFCFSCNQSNHMPIPCFYLKKWAKKCMDDSETSNWIHANTKECSKCQSTIEKNGGCNHMICKRCNYEFCWVCMGPWNEHGTQWYNCSRFEENSSLNARDNQARSRAALERYLFYFNRYANHEQSLKLDKELYVKTNSKMEEMQQHSKLSWIDVQYMKSAVDILGKARTILK